MRPPELRDDLLLDGRLHLEMDHLLGDDGARGEVPHAVNNLTKLSLTKTIHKA